MSKIQTIAENINSLISNRNNYREQVRKRAYKEEAEYSPFLYVLPYYFAALCSSRFLIMGRMIPSAVSTQGVMILRHIVNGSVSYTPSRQHAAVTKKHQPPAASASVSFFTKRYSGLNLLPALRSAIYAVNTHR